MESREQTYTNKKKNKLLQGIVVGALAGAAISMLDRSTRESVIACSKKKYNQMKDYMENPELVMDQIREKADKIRTTFEDITEDVVFIANQVEVLKEIPQQVVATVKDSKGEIGREEK